MILATLFTATAAVASQTSCPEHFAGGEAPDFINHQLEDKIRELCYSGYASKHSGVVRTSLYSAEHLTKNRIEMARGMKRDSEFHPRLGISQYFCQLRHTAVEYNSLPGISYRTFWRYAK